MSECVLPVPPLDESYRSPRRKGARDSIRPPWPWTDTATGEVYPVVLDPRDKHYQVGLSTGTTLRVPAAAYSELSGFAFRIVKQGAELAKATGLRRVRVPIHRAVPVSSVGDWTLPSSFSISFGVGEVERALGSDTWTLVSWN